MFYSLCFLAVSPGPLTVRVQRWLYAVRCLIFSHNRCITPFVFRSRISFCWYMYWVSHCYQFIVVLLVTPASSSTVLSWKCCVWADPSPLFKESGGLVSVYLPISAGHQVPWWNGWLWYTYTCRLQLSCRMTCHFTAARRVAVLLSGSPDIAPVAYNTYFDIYGLLLVVKVTQNSCSAGLRGQHIRQLSQFI